MKIFSRVELKVNSLTSNDTLWWKPGQNAQNGGNQDNTVRFKY